VSTPDGWTVEVVHLDGREWFQVKHHGYLVGGGDGKLQGLVATMEEVEELLGDAFEQLR